VVGGGDTACEEAVFLTKFASRVYLAHRRDYFRASAILADRALSNPKIEPIWNSVIVKYLPDTRGEMEGVILQNVVTGETTRLDVKCVFIAIGHTPNTQPFRGFLAMDDNGYLLRTVGFRTNFSGVFAAGDVCDPVYRQAVTAAGQGCAAAMDAERYLCELECAEYAQASHEENHHPATAAAKI
jgi:thioredoxin reductase (NADPH)